MCIRDSPITKSLRFQIKTAQTTLSLIIFLFLSDKTESYRSCNGYGNILIGRVLNMTTQNSMTMNLSFIEIQGNSSEAVSYTHLDVYKRQLRV